MRQDKNKSMRQDKNKNDRIRKVRYTVIMRATVAGTQVEPAAATFCCNCVMRIDISHGPFYIERWLVRSH